MQLGTVHFSPCIRTCLTVLRFVQGWGGVHARDRDMPQVFDDDNVLTPAVLTAWR